MGQTLGIIMIIHIISLILFSTEQGQCQPQATASCDQPFTPPTLKEIERTSFSNKEEVVINCPKDGFSLDEGRIQCNNGRWSGQMPRCGRNMEAQVKHLNIFKCDSTEKTLLLSKKLNQSDSDYRLADNAFHRLRLDKNNVISTNGSKCYTYGLIFDKKIQYWYLKIELWVNCNTILPELVINNSKYRTCELRRNKTSVGHSIQNKPSLLFTYYFICDLNSTDDYKKERKELSDEITFDIKTDFTGQLGLEKVVIGDVFTDWKDRPECGKIQRQNTGMKYTNDFGYYTITCNNSFIDLSVPNGSHANPTHQFNCNRNGQWVGNWPVCLPIKSCSNEIIFSDKTKSVSIEEIGNVYYLNESQWFAINESFIRYSCREVNHIMFGKNFITCLKNGQWSDVPPYCKSSGMSGLAIAGILFAVLIVFVSIVLFMFWMHSKRVEKELKETRNELQQTNRKIYSEELYDEIGELNYYETVFDKEEDINDDIYAEYDYSNSHPRYDSKTNNRLSEDNDYPKLSKNYQMTNNSEQVSDYLIMSAPVLSTDSSL